MDHILDQCLTGPNDGGRIINVATSYRNRDGRAAKRINQEDTDSGMRYECSYSKVMKPVCASRSVYFDHKQIRARNISIIILFFSIMALLLAVTQIQAGRLVRLCIASVDLVKLSSQCVMCNRREFPLTVNDCTGITKMNDLIANPLSVQDATCLIYNCRRQVPDIRPEPYHGSVSAVRTNYPSTSGSRSYEMMASPGMYGSYSETPPVSRWNGYGSSSMQNGDPFSSPSSPSMMSSRQQALPYALVPAPYTSPFGEAANNETLTLMGDVVRAIQGDRLRHIAGAMRGTK